MFCHSKAERKKWGKKNKERGVVGVGKGGREGVTYCVVIAVISDVCENINKWNCIIVFQKEQKTLNVMSKDK